MGEDYQYPMNRFLGVPREQMACQVCKEQANQFFVKGMEVEDVETTDPPKILAVIVAFYCDEHAPIDDGERATYDKTFGDTTFGLN